MINQTLCFFFVLGPITMTSLAAQPSRLKSSVITAGAATLYNGSIVTIGQPFVGVMSATDGSVSVSSGLLPTLLPNQSRGNPLVINPTFTFQNGQFQFGFPTQPGQNYVVEASTNLLNWTPIWTNAGTWTGLQFADAQSGLYPWRFYRVSLLPTPAISPLIFAPTFTLLSGRFQFGFPTQPGHNYVVETSTNLLDWTPVWTNVGTWTDLLFEDAQAGQYRWRFYRVKSD